MPSTRVMSIMIALAVSGCAAAQDGCHFVSTKCNSTLVGHPESDGVAWVRVKASADRDDEVLAQLEGEKAATKGIDDATIFLRRAVGIHKHGGGGLLHSTLLDEVQMDKNLKKGKCCFLPKGETERSSNNFSDMADMDEEFSQWVEAYKDASNKTSPRAMKRLSEAQKVSRIEAWETSEQMVTTAMVGTCKRELDKAVPEYTPDQDKLTRGDERKSGREDIGEAGVHEQCVRDDKVSFLRLHSNTSAKYKCCRCEVRSQAMRDYAVLQKDVTEDGFKVHIGKPRGDGKSQMVYWTTKQGTECKMSNVGYKQTAAEVRIQEKVPLWGGLVNPYNNDGNRMNVCNLCQGGMFKLRWGKNGVPDPLEPFTDVISDTEQWVPDPTGCSQFYNNEKSKVQLWDWALAQCQNSRQNTGETFMDKAGDKIAAATGGGFPTLLENW